MPHQGPHQNHPPLRLPPPTAVFFDMDGTLTTPLLDFDQIRADIGIAQGLPILEAISRFSPPDQARAQAILHHHEITAALHSALNPGAHEVLTRLATLALPTALITRNSLACARIVLDKHTLPFTVVITREDPPYKPHPDPIWLACKRTALNPTPNIWMVGDGSHDIAAANAAGVTSIWLSHHEERDFPTPPTHTIATLQELLPLLTNRN